MQFPLAKSIKPKGFEKLLLLTHNFIRNQPAHTQHLEAMVTVRDYRCIAIKMVKNREAVGSKTPDSS